MTLQQLSYIVAVDRHRSFAHAAETLGITQPTLSGMIQKLETELDLRLFDRNNRKVEPTPAGEKILRQAERVLAEAEQIKELADNEKNNISGNLALAVGPSIAPYILPEFIRRYTTAYPQINFSVEEMKVENMFDALLRSHIDAGIAISGNARKGIFEIPLYTEKFWVYLSETCSRNLPVFSPSDLEHENMWIMKDAQCLRESAFSFCKSRAKGRNIYQAGNIDTLIRIVDSCGGYTIIPEMHLKFLTARQQANVRQLDGGQTSERKISMYIKSDYVRQRMLNTVSNTLLQFIPHSMVEPKLTKFGIRL